MFQPSALNAWAQLAEQQGDTTHAHQLYRQALECNPHHLASLQALGCLEAAARNYEQAELLFKAATSVKPSHGPSWVAWALMEVRRGRRRRAAHLFKEGSVSAEGHVPLLSAWARFEVSCVMIVVVVIFPPACLRIIHTTRTHTPHTHTLIHQYHTPIPTSTTHTHTNTTPQYHRPKLATPAKQ